jgi:hypothetical protein
MRAVSVWLEVVSTDYLVAFVRLYRYQARIREATQKIGRRVPNIRAQVEHQRNILQVAQRRIFLFDEYLTEDIQIAASVQPCS